jgi:hypothetical protein
LAAILKKGRGGVKAFPKRALRFASCLISDLIAQDRQIQINQQQISKQQRKTGPELI